MEVFIGIFGSSGVGKSALKIQFCSGYFVEEYDPTIDSGFNKTVTLTDYHGHVFPSSDVAFLRLEEFLEHEPDNYWNRYGLYMNAHLVVYSVLSRDTFDQARATIKKIKETENFKDKPVLLCANKCDIDGDQREISSYEGQQLAVFNQVHYIETSAKTNKNVYNAFCHLGKMVGNIQSRKYYDHRVEQIVSGNKSKSIWKKQNIPPLNLTYKIPEARLYDENDYEVTPPNISIRSSTFAHDLHNLFQEATFCDIFFVGFDVKIPAHKFIIKARNPKLYSLIVASCNNEVNLPFKPTTIKLFLEYLYCDNIKDLQQLKPKRISQLWDMGVELNSIGLMNRISVHPNNISKIFHFPFIGCVSPLWQDYYRDIAKALNDEELGDIKIKIKGEDKTILANRALLFSRCPYFKAMFSTGTKENQQQEIELEEIDFIGLNACIEYCYSDKLEGLDKSAELCLSTLFCANTLCMERLGDLCARSVVLYLSWDNIIQMYRMSTMLELDSLRKYTSFIIIRVIEKLTTHKDYTILTGDEVLEFRNSRPSWWKEVADLSNYWVDKLQSASHNVDLQIARAPVSKKGKKCILM